MHVEALAWFDHWLKDRDTGIRDGRESVTGCPGPSSGVPAMAWPPTIDYHELGLGADGLLAAQPQDGGRELLCWAPAGPPGPGPQVGPAVGPVLADGPLTADLDIAGDIELRLSATSTAIDTAWIVMLRDVGPDGTITSVTGGWCEPACASVTRHSAHRRAGHSRAATPRPFRVGKPVNYRIPLVPNARRFAAGHRVQLMITSDDQPTDVPVFLGYRHSPVGTPPATPSTPPPAVSCRSCRRPPPPITPA